jgi:hypothetical protein
MANTYSFQDGSQYDSSGKQTGFKGVDPQSFANFQKANPKLNFGAEDFAHYQAAGSSNVISSNSLAPKPPITPVSPTPDATNYSGMTGGITQSIMDEYKTLNDKQAAAQANQQSTGTSILDYMKQLENKTADTKAANDAAGVTAETANLNKYAQQLADLNAQASSLNREAQAIPLQTQENNRNTGATDRGVAPQDAGALRLNALKALSIGQQSDIAAAAATGSQLRLQAAKDKAQQIIDLKYKPIESEIALKQKQYDLNKDVLDSIDKKRSEALQASLTKEAQDLVDKKAQEKQLTDMIVNASAQGAPAASVAAAKNAKTPLEAAQILGKYSGDYLKYELLKSQIQTEKAQQANYAANIAKTKIETSLLTTPGGGKPATQEQLQAAGFAERLQTSGSIIDGLSKKVTAMNYASYITQSKVPSKYQSDDFRQYQQAVTNFITAKLRKESGAAIAQSEFEDAYKVYIPQPGDDATTLKNKTAARTGVTQNMIDTSGVAYKAPTDNPFNQALGKDNSTISGSSILSGISSSGELNFKIPGK